jgi:hypothetical protein
LEKGVLAMQITLSRTGGLRGGVERLGPVDTGADVESGMLEPIVTGIDFFSLGRRVGSTGIRDGVECTISVQDDGRHNEVGFTAEASDVPEDVRELFEAVEKVASDHGVPWQAG